ncbi:MAG TPA: DUF1638 domain-containing protein [Methanothrix soehngenii]|nr:DUF1638 domain-containing protein [Methanothrix soehngenii]
MPVLSIVLCRMLEDEVAHLLSADRQVREILLVDGIESMSLSAKLKALGRPHIMLSMPGIAEHIAEQQKDRSRPPGGLFSRCLRRLLRPRSPGCASDLTVVASPLRIGLHTSLERLKHAVYDDIGRLSAFSDGILIFYGKCGNSLSDLEKDFAGLSCPLYFLADEGGDRIDDCIAAALGGNEVYARTLAEHQDVALFLTPMWAANWKAMDREEATSGSRRELAAMLKGTGMTRVARIDTGLGLEKGFDENVEAFAGQFGLETISLTGTTAVAEKSYQQAKRKVKEGTMACIPQLEI